MSIADSLPIAATYPRDAVTPSPCPHHILDSTVQHIVRPPAGLPRSCLTLTELGWRRLIAGIRGSAFSTCHGERSRRWTSLRSPPSHIRAYTLHSTIQHTLPQYTAPARGHYYWITANLCNISQPWPGGDSTGLSWQTSLRRCPACASHLGHHLVCNGLSTSAGHTAPSAATAPSRSERRLRLCRSPFAPSAGGWALALEQCPGSLTTVRGQ